MPSLNGASVDSGSKNYNEQKDANGRIYDRLNDLIKELSHLTYTYTNVPYGANILWRKFEIPHYLKLTHFLIY